MKPAFAVLIVLHGLIHLLGFAKGWGLGQLSQLQLPISRTVGSFWFLAAVILLSSAAALYSSPRCWGLILIVGIGVSQVLIFQHYRDAKVGTVANLLLLVPALVNALDLRPTSLRSEFLAASSRLLASARDTPVDQVREAMVTDADLTHLPEPVQRYLRRSGVVGKPRAHNMYAHMSIQIRAGADDPWMNGTVEQYNDFDAGLRFFFLKARRGPIPVDVAHLFDERGATMRARVLGLWPVMDAEGPDLTRSETVTLLNDMCLFAPASLLSHGLTWRHVDSTQAEVVFTREPHQVSALLFFNTEGDLVNFVSQDRSQSDGKTTVRLPWWTPVSSYSRLGDSRLVSTGEAQWEAPDGRFTYAKVQVLEVRYNVSR
jgi:hypothetical protein